MQMYITITENSSTFKGLIAPRENIFHNRGAKYIEH